jgi:hypothetical protein
MIMIAMPPITPPTIAPVLFFFSLTGVLGSLEGVPEAVIVGGATDSGPTCAWARSRLKPSFAYVGKLRTRVPTVPPLDAVGMPLVHGQRRCTPCQSLIGGYWRCAGRGLQRPCQRFRHLVQRLPGWKSLKSVGPRSNARTEISDIWLRALFQIPRLIT